VAAELEEVETGLKDGRSSASRGRVHRRGPNGWGGSTQRRDAWGGVEMVGEGLEWAVCSSSAMVSTTVFGAAQEW
jgi:hypothetical protein